MPAFSIIVPIYNAEKTLHRCLDSLRMQTYDDYEVLMVENGSTDASGRFCREYAQKNDRFRLIESKENCGPSGARNLGLEAATGKWIAFVDSDDFVEPEYLGKLRDSFEDNEAVYMGYRQLDRNGTILSEHIPCVSGGFYEMLVELSGQDLFGYTWIKAFRKDSIGSERFPVDMNLFEDEVFACQVLSHCSRVAVIPMPLYNYTTGNPTSLAGKTHSDFQKKRDRVYCAWKALLEGYEKRAEVLEQKANEAVVSCRYYSFERNVEPKTFFWELSGCEFFRDATLHDCFSESIRKGQFRKALWLRWLYRLKVSVARLVKG